MPPPLLDTLVTLFSTFSRRYICQTHILFRTYLPRGHSISCPIHHLKQTNIKTFTGWIEFKRVTASRAVAHQNYVAKYLSHSGIHPNHLKTHKHKKKKKKKKRWKKNNNKAQEISYE